MLDRFIESARWLTGITIGIIGMLTFPVWFLVYIIFDFNLSDLVTDLMD